MRFDLTHLPTWIVTRWKQGSGRRKTIVATVVLFLAFAATSLGSMYYGVVLNKTRRAITWDQMLENVVGTKLAVIPHWVQGQLFSRPERLGLTMDPLDFAKLKMKRDAALKTGILNSGDDDFVPAFLQHGAMTTEVRIRLKGDWTDQLLGDKWSFRLKIKGDQTLYGMKQFSLHHPRARGFAYEWLFHRALKREDIMALRYDFVQVSINGKDLGVYALEEHFEKRLIENQQRREGPIVKMNEELLWADRASAPPMTTSPTGLQSEHAGFVDAFGLGSVLDSKAMYKRFVLGGSLLEAVRAGELPAHKAFDTQRMATYFALCDLLGSEHAVIWHNLRFYYNPLTALLEPIGFDANAGHLTVVPHGAQRRWDDPAREFKNVVFSDPVFSQEYTKALERLSKPGYLESLLADTRKDLDQQLSILYKEFPWIHYSPSVFEHNRAVIVATLNPKSAVHAYAHARTAETMDIEVGNIQSMPLEVESISFRDSLVLRPSERIFLAPKVPDLPVDYRLVSFPLPADFPASVKMARELKIRYRIAGASTARTEAVFAWPRQNNEVLSADLVRQEPNVDKLPCFAVDEDAKRITIRPGRWEIGESVVIPGGYDVVAGPGTELFLAPDVTILSYSRFLFRGTAEAPVVIRSDGRGRGVLVAKTGGESKLEHTHFLDLANPNRNGWEVTSAVTFYEAPAHFTKCVFAGSKCEDALNMFRTTYVLENCKFADTRSDAFDADFANGRIVDSYFENCGNDAIDVSGSNAEVVNLRVNGTGDKGVSVGENSRLTARHLRLQRTAIGLASKDFSNAHFEDVSMQGGGVGLTLYVKKPEFGPSSMSVDGLVMADIQMPYLVEKGAQLTVDGAHIVPNRTVVRDELYGARYGKATKR